MLAFFRNLAQWFYLYFGLLGSVRGFKANIIEYEGIQQMQTCKILMVLGGWYLIFEHLAFVFYYLLKE